MSRDEAEAAGLLETIDREIDDAFVELIKSYSLRPELLRERGSELKVVYTPLHGTGTMMVERILSEAGIEVITVPEQREPDGNFPTVEYPNPEEASAMRMALGLAAAEKADLVMGTDPDSDRLGIAVIDEKGEYLLLNGNQLGSLLADYILLSRTEAGTMPAEAAYRQDHRHHRAAASDSRELRCPSVRRFDGIQVHRRYYAALRVHRRGLSLRRRGELRLFD